MIGTLFTAAINEIAVLVKAIENEYINKKGG